MKFRKAYLLQSINTLIKNKNKLFKQIKYNNNTIMNIKNNNNIKKKKILKINNIIFNKKRLYSKLDSK
jgi:hypothetical protein